MKKSVTTISLLVGVITLFSFDNIFAQCDAWTQKADFGGTVREQAVGFSIGNKGYIGTGGSSTTGTKDFWEYNPTTNIWTQKADFGGTARRIAAGFSIGSKGYIGTGWDGAYTQDFWEYDTTSNTWTQKANFGGTARASAVGFSIGNKGYIGTGTDGANKKDLWEYDTTTNIWTQKTDFGGTARRLAAGFSIGSKGYIGTGWDGGFTQDFWEYSPNGNAWTQKTDFGGPARYRAVGFSIGSKGYIGTGAGVGYKQDFWEYDTTSNIWTQKANFGGSARDLAVGFSIGSKGYIGTGAEGLGGPDTKDFWEYIPSPPAITSDTSANIADCNGDSTGTIGINAIGTSILYYSIDGGLTFSDTSGNFTGLGAGSYDIIVQDANGCTDTGSTIIITEPPAINFDTITSTPDTNNTGVGTVAVSVSGGTPPYTYLWTPSGQTDSTAIGLIIGMYIINIQDSNDCFYEDSVYVGNITGITESRNAINTITLYPNPNTGQFTLEIVLNKQQNLQLKIFDILGQEILSEELKQVTGTLQKQIDLSSYSRGIYNLQLLFSEGVVNKKIVIE